MDKAAVGLAQLRDIRLPEPIHWWPLAPGWYILLLLILFLMGLLSYFVYKKIVNARPKKEGLRLLMSYRQSYEKEGNSQVTSALVSELLKRVALAYFPRNEVASLHGGAWIDFLNKTSLGLDFKAIQSLLLDAPFKVAEPIDLSPLIKTAQQWIQQRRKVCSN